jgi:ring-1,2-phenylacetyl-CoA epoxidase subunit PaaD
MVNEPAGEPEVSGSAGRTSPAGPGVSAWTVAARTPDPELPTLTLADLGILRDVREDGDTVVATITPTYSGCPAMHEISHDLRHRLQRAGFRDVQIRTQLAPAWSSDWITAEGRAKLTAAGIAPPSGAAHRGGPIPLTLGRPAPVPCPRCGSRRTSRTAAFGATACKALHRCEDCREPFEAVKPI